jgi:hypothetical protein
VYQVKIDTNVERGENRTLHQRSGERFLSQIRQRATCRDSSAATQPELSKHHLHRGLRRRKTKYNELKLSVVNSLFSHRKTSQKKQKKPQRKVKKRKEKRTIFWTFHFHIESREGVFFHLNLIVAHHPATGQRRKMK